MPTYAAILDAEIAPEAPVTTSLLTRLRDNALAYLGAPAGTLSLFHQTSAPLGWTKIVSHNDKALRLVSGAAGTGGSLAFSTAFARTATDAFTIAQGNLPAANTGNQSANHHHDTAHGKLTITYATGANNLVVLIDNQSSTPQNFTSGNESADHAHALGGSGTAIQAGMDMRVQYIDVILAQKD